MMEPMMEGTIPILVSTLYGSLVSLDVSPSMKGKHVISLAFRHDRLPCGTPKSMASPLAINADLAAMQTSGGIVRLSSWDGDLKDDIEEVHSGVLFNLKSNWFEQPHALSSHLTLFKLVLFKQVDKLVDDDIQMAQELVKTGNSLLMTKPCGVQFHVHPVMGGEHTTPMNPHDKPDDEAWGYMVGVLYQHHQTAQHCGMMEDGIDLSRWGW